MINLTKITDPYERKARIYPGLIMLIPIVVTVYTIFPDIFNLWSSLAALLISFGTLHFLANLARDRGKALETILFEQWGGMPSVQILRYHDKEIPAPAKKRYHKILEQQTAIDSPIENEELSAPSSSEQIYRSWSDYLRGKTRNVDEFPLVFKENVNYGFRRNLLGLKCFCIFAGLVGIAVTGTKIFLHFQKSSEISEVLISVLVGLVIYVLIFLFVVNRNWVKTPAYAYARQLIESLNA